MDEKRLNQIKSKIDNLEQISQSDIEFLYNELISYKARYERKSQTSNTIRNALINAAVDLEELTKARRERKQ